MRALEQDLFDTSVSLNGQGSERLAGTPGDYLVRHVPPDMSEIPLYMEPEVSTRLVRVGGELVRQAYDRQRPAAIRQTYPADTLAGVAAAMARGIFDRERYDVPEGTPWLGQEIDPETGRLSLRVNDLAKTSGRLALTTVRLGYVGRGDFREQQSGLPGLSWESKPGVERVPVLAVSAPVGVDTLADIANISFLPTGELARSFVTPAPR